MATIHRTTTTVNRTSHTIRLNDPLDPDAPGLPQRLSQQPGLLKTITEENRTHTTASFKTDDKGVVRPVGTDENSKNPNP